MSVLLSCLLTYGNLSSNSEILALKSLGINNYRIVLPSLLLAVFMTFLTFTFSDNLVPISNRVASDLLQNSLGKSMRTEVGKAGGGVGKRAARRNARSRLNALAHGIRLHLIS